MSLKNLRPFDVVIIALIIIVLAVAVLAYFGKNKFGETPVEATKKIAFQVMLKSVSLTDTKSPFVIGDESFISIRNVPYTKLQIIDVIYQPKKIVLPVNNPAQPFAVVEDFSQPFQYDFVVSLIDEAKITKDGPVVGGNKIKIGLPIVLEGFNYRIGGTVSNIRILDDNDLSVVNKYIEEARKAQAEQLKQEKAQKADKEKQLQENAAKETKKEK